MICETVYERLGISYDDFRERMKMYSGLTISEISSAIGIDNTTAIKYAREFDVSYKINHKLKSLDKKLGISKEELKQVLQDHLNEDMSLSQIAKIYGISTTAIHNYLKKFNISRRNKLRNPEWLRQRYLIDEVSSEDIAKECGVSGEAVRWHMKKNGIQLRTLSQAQQIAQHKRDNDMFVSKNGRSKSRGYMIRYNGMCFRSAAEYLWYKINKPLYDCIGYERFVFDDRRPDFLVNKSHVIEVKCSRTQLSDEEYDGYIEYGRKLSDSLGFTYEVVFMKDNYPEEYAKLITNLQDIGARPSIEFTLLDEI